MGVAVLLRSTGQYRIRLTAITEVTIAITDVIPKALVTYVSIFFSLQNLASSQHPWFHADLESLHP